MKTKILKNRFLFSLIIIFCLFLSCKNSVNFSENKSGDDGVYITVSFNYNESNIRSISPKEENFSKAVLYYQLCSDNEETVNEIKSLYTWEKLDLSSVRKNKIMIDSGNYNFYLELYSNGILSQAGALKDVSIVQGSNDLQFNTNWVKEGIGNLNVKLKWQNTYSIESVKCGLFTLESEGEEALSGFEFEELEFNEESEYPNITFNYVNYLKNNVPCGYYLIRFEFYSNTNNLMNTLEDVVKIYAGLESSYSEEFYGINTTHTITYDLNGGEWADGFIPVTERNVTQGVLLPTAEQVLRDDCVLNTWKEVNEQYTIEKISAGTKKDFVLKALWIPLTRYKITYITDGNNPSENPSSYTVLDEIIFKEADMRGFTFEGWYIDSIEDEANKIELLPEGSKGDITLIAKWSVKKCRVSFISNTDDVENPEDIVYTYNDKYGNLPVLHKENSVFLGWFTEPQEGTKINAISVVKDSITLYAHWTNDALNASEAVTAISDLQVNSTVAIKGIITASDFYNIREAINAKSNVKVSLNLLESEVTDNNFYAEAPNGTKYGAFENCKNLSGIVLPQTITLIPERTFYQCRYLTEIIIPDTVTEIKDFAFYCAGLGYVKLSSTLKSLGNYSFAGCYFDSIELPYGLETIGDGVFMAIQVSTLSIYGGELKSIIIPDTVTTMGKDVFYMCWDLKTIKLSDSLDKINNSTFYDCMRLEEIVFPDSVEYIGDEVFYGCDALKEITIPDSVTEIGTSLFDHCMNLQTVNLSQNITVIPYRTFYYCENLENISFSPTVTEIGGESFRHCYKLTYLELPRDLNILGSSVFNGCNDLTFNDLPQGLTTIGQSAFAWTSITSAVIPEGTTKIALGAFKGCKSLKTVVIPEGVTKIEAGAFSGTEIEALTIPASLTKIFEHTGFSDPAFGDSIKNLYYNGTLEQWFNIGFNHAAGWSLINNPLQVTENFYIQNELVTADYHITEGIDAIGNYAFYGYKKFENVTIPATVTKIGKDIFGECENLQKIYYEGSQEQWWNINFAEYSPLYLTNADLYINNQLLTVLQIPQGTTFIKDYVYQGLKSITEVNIPDSVTAIGKYAFEGCTGLESIVIPGSVETIGQNAFQYCEKLSSVTLEDGIKEIRWDAFGNCISLETIVIPDSVTSCSSFNNCTNLKNVTLSNNLQAVSGFSGCTSLQTIQLPSSIREIGGFKDCENLETINIPESVWHIYESAFEGCKKIKTISITNSKAFIESRAFYGCSSLESIDLPEFLELPDDSYYHNHVDAYDITNSVFYGCTSLKSIRIPENVECINKAAFEECSNLEYVYFPQSLKWIKDSAFANCSALHSDIIFSSVEYIRENAFLNCSNIENVKITGAIESLTGFSGCSKLKSFEVSGDNLWYVDADFKGSTELESCIINSSSTDSYNKLIIKDEAFADCTKLTNVELIGNIGSIGQNAFRNCISLESITIPQGITELSDFLFNNCTALKNVLIPDSVKTIGTASFVNCTSLDILTIPEGCTTIEMNAFQGTGFNKIIIPDSITAIEQTAFGMSLITSTEAVQLPSTIKEIGRSWFFNCDYLETIVIPETIESIGPYAFAGAIHVKDIYMPTSVKSIDRNAFAGLYDRDGTIHYLGTAEQWAELIADKEFEAALPLGYSVCFESETDN